VSWSVTTEKDRILPEGTYRAIVADLEKIDTSFGERIMWKFDVPAEDVTVVGFSSLSASLKSKGARWARAILGIVEDRFNWGPEELKGMPCTITVDVSEDADGYGRNIVEKVKPPRGEVKEPSGNGEDDKPDFHTSK
jgi:hypothetical protein